MSGATKDYQLRFSRILQSILADWRVLLERWPLLPLAFAAGLGVLVDYACESSGILTPVRWLTMGLVLVVVYPFVPKSIRGLTTLLLVVPVFGFLSSYERFKYDRATLIEYVRDHDPAIVEGVIDSAPTLQPHPMAGLLPRRNASPWMTEFTCRVDGIRVVDRIVPVTGRIAVNVDDNLSELTPGSQVRLYGTIAPPRWPSNPGERDQRVSYRMRGLHARMSVSSRDHIESLSPPSTTLHGMIARFANEARQILLRHTSPSTNGLAVALVVGQRDFVDPSTSDQLLVTGTAHLLSVSGLHLAIVVLLARYVGVWLRFPTSVQVLQILTVGILYAAITGGNPPVIRAAVLVGLFVLSTLLRRPSQPINTLAFAALLLLGWQPSLLFNVGVQLSFLAVATLMLCGRSCPDAESTLEEFRDRDERLRELADQSMGWLWRRGLAASMWLRQGIWYSGCVTTIGLPLVWHQFHVVSPISVLTNVCLSIPLTIALASGIFTVLLGGIWPALGSLPGVICHASLVVILELIQFFAGLPYGHVWLPAPPTWLVILFYVGILVSLVIPETKWSRRARFAGIGIWIVIAWIVATRPTALREGVIEATFVNVGHGTGVVLRFADDQVWLYDCGRLGNTPTSSAGVDAVLWSLGVSHLQGIMISHADIDHYNGIPAILTRFRVDRLYSPAGVLANTDPNMVSLQTQIDRLGIPYQPLHTGASIEVGKFKMLIQHPPTERCAGSDNANSLVVTIHGTGVPLILPGDLEPPGLDLLLNQERPRAGGVLMAPHHGSLQLDARSILDWSRASVVIVSGGQRTENPEVSASLSVTGAQVLVTHQAGAIRVRLASDGTVETKSWNSDSWRN